MQVDNKNSIRFTSRNATIRFADDIVRKVNQEFPRISSSRVDDFLSVKSKPCYQKILWNKILRLRDDRLKEFSNVDDFVKKFECLLSPIKKYKLGNCTESTQLTSIVARLNGIKNSYPALMISPNGFDLDHAVLYVNDEKPYIMDAWLGFADFVPEAKLRYQNEFKKHFEFELAESDDIIFQKYKNVYFNFLTLDFSNKQMKKLQKTYPELIIKKVAKF